MMTIDWSNRILYSASDIRKDYKCTYCEQDVQLDKKDDCPNCGAHKEVPNTVVSMFEIKETR